MGRLYIDNTKYDNDGNNGAYNDTDDDSNDISTYCDAYKVWWHTPFSLVDLGGMPSTHPQWSKILSFWHTKFLKCNHLGNPHPRYEVNAPMGIPGFINAFGNVYQMSQNCN